MGLICSKCEYADVDLAGAECFQCATGTGKPTEFSRRKKYRNSPAGNYCVHRIVDWRCLDTECNPIVQRHIQLEQASTRRSDLEKEKRAEAVRRTDAEVLHRAEEKKARQRRTAELEKQRVDAETRIAGLTAERVRAAAAWREQRRIRADRRTVAQRDGRTVSCGMCGDYHTTVAEARSLHGF